LIAESIPGGPVLKVKLNELARIFPSDFCLICGGVPAITGAFIPDDPISWGSPEGKTRIVLYQICKGCLESKEIQEKVEKVIRYELTNR
jgi:hypothetical protein